MTVTELLEMYKGKKAFVNDLSRAFEGKPVNSSVERIDYEVYRKEVARDENIYWSYIEFVIVRFFGGGKCVDVVSGNSNTANFRAIGKMLDGGHYDKNPYYDSILETGYSLVDLSSKDILTELLSKPMTHISDIRKCFNYCANGNDVNKVIRMIPNCFGSFEAEYGEDEETFTIINYYEENGVDECEEAEYEFYCEE
jgi:hypothetical protein